LSGGHRHLPNRIDHQIGLVEMNPMRASLGDDLLNAVADAGNVFV